VTSGRGHVGSEAGEGIYRPWADDAVGLDTDVALKLPDGAIHVRPENPILAPRVKPKGVQLSLEIPDVIPAEMRDVQVERAITESPTRFDELAPRVGPDDAIGHERPTLLESPNRCVGGATECARKFAASNRQSLEEEALLDITNLRATGASTDEFHA